MIWSSSRLQKLSLWTSFCDCLFAARGTCHPETFWPFRCWKIEKSPRLLTRRLQVPSHECFDFSLLPTSPHVFLEAFWRFWEVRNLMSSSCIRSSLLPTWEARVSFSGAMGRGAAGLRFTWNLEMVNWKFGWMMQNASCFSPNGVSYRVLTSSVGGSDHRILVWWCGRGCRPGCGQSVGAQNSKPKNMARIFVAGSPDLITFLTVSHSTPYIT